MGNKASKVVDENDGIDIGVAALRYYDQKIVIDQDIANTYFEHKYPEKNVKIPDFNEQIIELGPGFVPNFYSDRDNKITRKIILEKLYHFYKFGNKDGNGCSDFEKQTEQLTRLGSSITQQYQERILDDIKLKNKKVSDTQKYSEELKTKLNEIEDFMTGPNYIMAVQQKIIKLCNAQGGLNSLIDYDLQRFIINYTAPDKKIYQICQPVFSLGLGFNGTPEFNLIIILRSKIGDICRYAVIKLVITSKTFKKNIENKDKSEISLDIAEVVINKNGIDTLRRELKTLLNENTIEGLTASSLISLTQNDHLVFIKDVENVVNHFIQQNIFKTNYLSEVLRNIENNTEIGIKAKFVNESTTSKQEGGGIIGVTILYK